MLLWYLQMKNNTKFDENSININSEIGKILRVSCYNEKVKCLTGEKKNKSPNEKFKLSIDKYNNRLETEVLPEFLHDSVMSSWFIGGSGKKPRNCRKCVPLRFCKECGQIYLVNGSCNNPKCPDCFNRWRYNRSENATRRLESFRIEKKMRIAHFMVSINELLYKDLKSPDKVSKLMKNRIYPFLKKKKVHGGWIVFHPFRIIESKKKELYDYFNKKNKDMSLGEFALWKVLGSLTNWRDFVYWSPHFHVLGSYHYSDPAMQLMILFLRELVIFTMLMI
jgi:Uncharacterized protein conserved in archaea